jgi:hypothetical protein
LSPLVRSPEDPLLYHYTTAEALQGIVESASLRASSTRFLNDEAEFVGAINSLKRYLGFLEEDTKTPEDARSLCQEIRREIQLRPEQATFVFSFSESRDLLSQWRAYCPASGGYAIGISLKTLSAMAGEQGFALAKCVYDGEDHGSQIVALVASARAALRTHPDPTTWRQEIIAPFLYRFYSLAPLLKHPAFSEEREWRLVLSPSMRGPSDRVKFQARAGLLIPYYEFSLGDIRNKLILGEIVIGPHRHQQLAFSTLMGFLGHSGVRAEEISASTIPFRVI